MVQYFTFISSQQRILHAITGAYHIDEATCVQQRLIEAKTSEQQQFRIQELAKNLVTKVRKSRMTASGVDALMHEFSLSSTEGVALMCLAEALLRIPDQATADNLIRDKITDRDWRSHLNNSHSLFVNAAAWGLLITGKLLAPHTEQQLSSAVQRTITKGSEPLIRKAMGVAMKMLGKQFVTGETIQQAIDAGKKRVQRGYRHSYDMLGEAAMTMVDADKYLADYQTAIHAVGKDNLGLDVYHSCGVSVKLSALHPRYSQSQYQRVIDELYPRLKALFLLAKQYEIGLNIDAEEANRLELSLDLIEMLLQDPDLQGFKGIGIVVQAYQKRCPFVIDALVDMAETNQRQIMVRLVKGAYWDAEIKRAQIDGVNDYPVYTRKAHTDIAYIACGKKLLQHADIIYPQFATHNAHTLATLYELANEYQVTRYEFQCLYGMGESLYDHVVGEQNLNVPCRIYAPVGSHQTLLAYLVRRLLENGANSSFVNQLVDESISLTELVADPTLEINQTLGLPHPNIPKPIAIYHSKMSTRNNSRGFELSHLYTLSILQFLLNATLEQTFTATPLLANLQATDNNAARAKIAVINPADQQDIVGYVAYANHNDVNHALNNALTAKSDWANTPVSSRAARLNTMANLMETHHATLLALAMREAGKTLPNAIAEIREAVDFCRFYADTARQQIDNQHTPALGIVIAISPWNFPLAVFIGQIASALVAGNVVIAKPAEQTSLIAYFACQLFYQAGIPTNVLQYLPGRGEEIGSALTQSELIDGVIFTGSTSVAKLIEQAIANQNKPITLIAETGGQNAMIVDSSALPEQVVSDVLASAFDSAGQRCSALRLLCLQTEIADKTITMLKGAMAELKVGNPRYLSTDIGPVIDEPAKINLQQHIDHLRQQALSITTSDLDPTTAASGTFIAPIMVEIADLSTLQQEVFGPVLHVVRFNATQLPALIDQINQLGFGLTHGIHSRIDETINQIYQQIQAGNVYVNRNIVGAVVGVQPFGGMGKSGTGPKAGGPLYLYRLTQAKQWLINSHNIELDTESKAVQAIKINRLGDWLLNLAVIKDDQQKQQQINQQIAAVLALSPLAKSIKLSGVTGEINQLNFVARQNIAIFGGHLEDNIAALIAITAAGASAVIDKDNPLATINGIENQNVQIVNQFDPQQIELLIALSPVDVSLKLLLCQAKERIIPIITSAQLALSLYPLLHEKALSVNTAAAGGNASLMSLGE